MVWPSEVGPTGQVKKNGGWIYWMVGLWLKGSLKTSKNLLISIGSIFWNQICLRCGLAPYHGNIHFFRVKQYPYCLFENLRPFLDHDEHDLVHSFTQSSRPWGPARSWMSWASPEMTWRCTFLAPWEKFHKAPQIMWKNLGEITWHEFRFWIHVWKHTFFRTLFLKSGMEPVVLLFSFQCVVLRRWRKLGQYGKVGCIQRSFGKSTIGR